MNIGSIILAVLAVNSLASAALFAAEGNTFATVVFLLAIPLFIRLAIDEATGVQS